MNNNPFTQTEITYKISTQCCYQDIGIIEENYIQNNITNLLSISTFELASLTIEAMPEDVWGVEIYLSEKPDLSKINLSFTKFCQQYNIKSFKEFSSEVVNDCDWVALYAKQLKPIETDKFFITSLLYRKECPVDKLPIYIEASRAFGTGQHETTKGCIKAIEYLSISNNFTKILDIGTGTGILAICAKKIWPNAEVFACDIEKTAIEVASDNSELNNTNIFIFENKEDRITIPSMHTQKFNLIVSNILARPLIELATVISEASIIDSYLILSGFLTTQLADVLDKFKTLGWRYIDCFTINSWAILILKF